MVSMIETDYFGRIPRTLNSAIRKYNVSPVDFWDLEAVFETDYSNMMAFILKHVEDGMYRAPWPFPFPTY